MDNYKKLKKQIERILKELEVETLDNELVNELLSLFNSNLKEQREGIIREVEELVEGNYKGAFTDDGGNNCWYVDDLIILLKKLATNTLEVKEG